MSEEFNNKIRLNEARRSAVKNRIKKADGSRSKESLYGGREEKKTAKNKKNPFKGMKNPIKITKKAKNIATAPTAIMATDIAIYGVAFALAGFKDLLDLAFIGSLPAVGTVVTFCVSIAIGFVLLFDGISSSQRRVARRMTRKFLVLIGGTIIEVILFGLNFLPFEMITVGVIYWMSLADRKANK
jgi:hypothetical protein